VIPGQSASAAPILRVLLLEDNDLDAELVLESVRAEGIVCDVRRAYDEETYAQVLSRKDFELILSDFSLPGYDGFRALDAARASVPEVPFIFVSGAIGEELAIESLRRGATDYVLKTRLDRLGPAVLRALAEAEDRRLRRVVEEERDRLLVSERTARDAAETANRLKDEFLALVSHELRTPLGAILGWAALLAESPENAVMVRKGVATIERNARAQARIIDDILDISRIITGKLHIDAQPVEVSSFIAAAMDAMRPAASAKGIEMVFEPHLQVGHVFGDAQRLQQIVWNLVSNAVKFTPAQGRITVAVAPVDACVEIRVEDTGIGIEPHLLPFVFDRFRQGDSTITRSHGGLGLGLSIVRHLVELHGGRVEVDSGGLGRGSSFSVRIPAGRSPPHETGPSEEDRSSDAEASASGIFRQQPLKGVRVLVVEDNPDTREVVAQILERSGAIVTATEGAQEALEIFAQGTFEIIVSDIGMPRVDGYAFMRSIRALGADAGGNVPAIALSAYARPQDRQGALDVGYQQHVAKPVVPHEIVSAVSALLGRT